MTKYDYLACLALVLAILINSLSVYLQRSRQLYKRFGHAGYAVHTTLISLAWGLFLVTEFLASRTTWRTAHSYPVAGLAIVILAVFLFLAAIKEIGTSALSNGNFFGRPVRKLAGIYRYIASPIYWSYAVCFLGLAALTGMKVFLVSTVLAVVGLVGFESWIERPVSSSHNKTL